MPISDLPMSTALLLGATGLVGRHLLGRLAHDARWTRVVTLDRRPVPRASATHEPRVVEFDRLEALDANLFAVDAVFCALGTTMKQAGSKDAFRHVDYEIPVAVARRAHAAGASQMLLVSSIGADAGSRVFYTRVKGEAEEAIEDVGFRSVGIARPSLLTGERRDVRTGELVSKALFAVAKPFLVGPLRDFRPMPATDVAACLVAFAASRRPGVTVLDSEAIRAWARS